MVSESVGAPTTLEMESIEELIERINRNTAAQREQTAQFERWAIEMGLAPPKTQEREPTELERLIQAWEQASAAPQSPEPRGEEPPLPEPRGEEPLLPEPRGEEPPLPEPRGEEPPLPEPRGEEPPLPEPRGEEPPLPEPRGEELPLPEPRGEEPPLPEPRGEEPPLPEPRGEEPPLPEPRGEEPPLPEPKGEVKSIPPPQPRPPPLRSSSAPLRPVPHPLLQDTLPVLPDLPVLDLEPRSVQHWPQLFPWFPASLSPNTQTSLGCCQTSLSLPLFAASFPLGDRTSLHRFPGEDLCPLWHPPVPRPTLRILPVVGAMSKAQIVTFELAPHPLPQLHKTLHLYPEDAEGGIFTTPVNLRLIQQILSIWIQAAPVILPRVPASATVIQQAPPVPPTVTIQVTPPPREVQQAPTVTSMATMSVQQAPMVVPSLSNAGVQQAFAFLPSAFSAAGFEQGPAAPFYFSPHTNIQKAPTVLSTLKSFSAVPLHPSLSSVCSKLLHFFLPCWVPSKPPPVGSAFPPQQVPAFLSSSFLMAMGIQQALVAPLANYPAFSANAPQVPPALQFSDKHPLLPPSGFSIKIQWPCLLEIP
ncbi:UNVERIFIED_CONTAM: hypothetical protein FKN15_021598 [Acipenser sinensis]